MPSTGYWRMLVEPALINPTGSTIHSPGDSDCVVYDLGSGTIQARFPEEPALYLDGSSTPVSQVDLPAGWTPDAAYVFHFAGSVAGSNHVTFDLAALGESVLHNGPDSVEEHEQALGGLTLLGLFAVPGTLVTAYMVVDVSDCSGSPCYIVVQTKTAGGPIQMFLSGTYHTVSGSWYRKTDGTGEHFKFAASPPGAPWEAADAPTPYVASCTPPSGPVEGGTAVWVLGTGFGEEAAVTFDGAAATAIVVVHSHRITCTTPSGAAGPANVVVTNADGTASG